jgi:hypothetical protein
LLSGDRDKIACIYYQTELNDTEDQREEDRGSKGEFN